MFTGIIEGLGSVSSVQSSGQGLRLAVDTEFELNQSKIGDSIAVNGVCLTAVTLSSNRFEVDVSPETVAISCFGKAKTGERVNIERALRVTDRLDGHIVSGHIDCTAVIKDRRNIGNAIIISFEIPKEFSRYIIKKGSIAIDGISLTVNNCDSGFFDVSIIPHTAGLTTVGFKKKGDAVNIETDMIGKYVENFIVKSPEQGTVKSSIDTKFLAEHGFLKI